MSDSKISDEPAPITGSYLSQNYKPQKKNTTEFICGECAVVSYLRGRDAIHCRECGHRIMYKKRERRPIEFEAL